jgi:diguanylate cyclase (GGDEF)-like protein
MLPTEKKALLDALDVLNPMHILVDAGGAVTHIGPSAKPFCPILGAQFDDVFSFTKPAGVDGSADLGGFLGQKLVVCLCEDRSLSLTGVAMPLFDGLVINLSLGLDVVDTVRRYNLTATDFAPTDQSVGMIYLTEAKTIAIEEFKRLNMRLNGAKTRAERAAQTDELTGLSNLRALREELIGLQNSDESFAIMTLDLDHFKAVNDSLGHAAGDHVLKETARILREETREGDVVARNGGDEFTLLLRGVGAKTTILEIAARIIDRIERPIMYDSATCHISASVGTIFSNDAEALDIEEMLSNADKALYSSKRAGRGRNTIYS